MAMTKDHKKYRYKGEWDEVVLPKAAAEIERIIRVTGVLPSLRQIFYVLVVAALIDNTINEYQQLSTRTAKARRVGWTPVQGGTAYRFPRMADLTRSVKRPTFWRDPQHAMESIRQQYRIDRTQGQDEQVWFVVEKATLEQQVLAWTQQWGIPVTALRGYASETHETKVSEEMLADLAEAAEDVAEGLARRPVIVFYIGDHDPSGHHIESFFKGELKRRGVVIQHWKRLGVTRADVAGPHALAGALNPAKLTDSRYDQFVKQWPAPYDVQVEAEAIPLDVLRQRVLDAVTGLLNVPNFDAVLDDEEHDRRLLDRLEDEVERYVTVTWRTGPRTGQRFWRRTR